MPKAKPKSPNEAGTSGDDIVDNIHASEHFDEAEDDLDMERRRLMARNRAKLIALGISVGVMELQDLARKRAHAHTPRPRPKPQSHKPAEPTRRSARLAGGSGGGGDGGPAAEPLLQLDEYGGAEVQGPGQAAPGEAAPRRGPRPRSAAGAEDLEAGLSAEEIAARAEQLRRREASRLRELELEGLVDLSREAAVFVVIGSTGNHYTVRLGDARRSCNCMDCRVRKRDCKHIRLILGRLQIQDDPSQWYQAVERSFHTATAASADDETQRPTHGSLPHGGADTTPNPRADADAGADAAEQGGRQQQQQQGHQAQAPEHREGEGGEERRPAGPATLPRASAAPSAGERPRKGARRSSGDGSGDGSSKRRRQRAGAAQGADCLGATAGAPPEAGRGQVVAVSVRETRASRKRAAAGASGTEGGAQPSEKRDSSARRALG